MTDHCLPTPEPFCKVVRRSKWDNVCKTLTIEAPILRVTLTQSGHSQRGEGWTATHSPSSYKDRLALHLLTRYPKCPLFLHRSRSAERKNLNMLLNRQEGTPLSTLCNDFWKGALSKMNWQTRGCNHEKSLRILQLFFLTFYVLKTPCVLPNAMSSLLQEECLGRILWSLRPLGELQKVGDRAEWWLLWDWNINWLLQGFFIMESPEEDVKMKTVYLL